MSKKSNLVNIQGGEADPFARYKMPDLEIRHKHSLTFILNLTKVAKALKINHLYLVKFWGQALNTMSKWNKAEENQINGIHSKEVLAKHLQTFIDKYVLCQICGLPEIDYYAKKKSLSTKCRACGAYEKCSTDDRIYKLIHQTELTNPSVKKFATKKAKAEKEKDKEPEFTLEDFPVDENEEEIEWNIDLSPEAVQARREAATHESQLMKDLFQ